MLGIAIVNESESREVEGRGAGLDHRLRRRCCCSSVEVGFVETCCLAGTDSKSCSFGIVRGCVVCCWREWFDIERGCRWWLGRD